LDGALSFRFSIATLMTFVLVLALGLAALRSGSEAWSTAVFTLTLVLHFTAILGAIYRRGRDRAGCLGFALFGWAYWNLSFGPWFRAEIGPQLVTTPLLEYLHPKIAPVPPPGAILDPDGKGWFVRGTSGRWTLWGWDTRDAFRRTGHSLGAVLFGLMGALVALAFERAEGLRRDSTAC
jgi:hypothetical protein